MPAPYRSRSLHHRVLQSVTKRWTMIAAPTALTAALLVLLGHPLPQSALLTLTLAAAITGLLAFQAAQRHRRTMPSRSPFTVAESHQDGHRP